MLVDFYLYSCGYHVYYCSVIYLVISLFYLQLSLLLLYMHMVSSARVLSLFTHTHYGRVLTTLGLHVQLLDDCLIVQVFDELVHFAESWTLSPSLHSGTLISSFISVTP